LLLCGLVSMLVALVAPAALAAPAVPMAQAASQPGATLDVNTASRADLEALRGLGVVMTERLLVARQAHPFRDWADLRHRVRGLSPARLRELSQQGLRVRGQAWPQPDDATPATPPSSR
jgi:competence protein ComEA